MNKQRNSSVELYRILATFLVIIVHLNGWLAGGMPELFSDYFRILWIKIKNEIYLEYICIIDMHIYTFLYPQFRID